MPMIIPPNQFVPYVVHNMGDQEPEEKPEEAPAEEPEEEKEDEPEPAQQLV